MDGSDVEFWWFDDSMRMDDKMDGMSFFGEMDGWRGGGRKKNSQVQKESFVGPDSRWKALETVLLYSHAKLVLSPVNNIQSANSSIIIIVGIHVDDLFIASNNNLAL